MVSQLFIKAGLTTKKLRVRVSALTAISSVAFSQEWWQKSLIPVLGRPVWSLEQVPGQPGRATQRDPVSKNPLKKLAAPFIIILKSWINTL